MTPDPENGTTEERTDQLAGYIASARWFGGKGRDFAVTSVTDLPLGPGVTTTLVGLRFADGEEPATALYQLPLSAYDDAQDRLQHAAVGLWGGRFYYDAVHDREAMQIWLRAFAGDPSADLDSRVAFTRVFDHVLDLDTHSTLFSGEQSNSSLAFGEDALLKIFRRVDPGMNPDIEIHEALTRSESTNIAALYGHTVVKLDGDVLELAMLQQFLRTASDGWELALASVRNLVMETDLDAATGGGDFAGEAYRLGANLAEIHAVLASAFDTGTADPGLLADQMLSRQRIAGGIVPELGGHGVALSERFEALRSLDPVPVQRVHGDLHLGQTLRTSLGWKFVDFEGEPAKPLTERRLPDSPWRDVAGMIRSFDYAASTVSRDLGGTEAGAAEIAYRASTWTAHTAAAFLAGYTEARGAPVSDAEAALLSAFIADKAIYEAVYEARNRPNWLAIPLAALAGIAAEGL